MSELFGRMLDRAAGRTPTVRAALAPRLLPGPAIQELSVDAEAAPPRPAPERTVERVAARAASAEPGPVAPRALAPDRNDRIEPMSVVPPSTPADVDRQPPVEIHRLHDTHEIVTRETITPTTSPIAAPDAARSPAPAVASSPAIIEVSAVAVAPPPIAPRALASTPAAPLAVLDDPFAPDAELPPAPPRRGHAPAPKLDLRDALAVVGRVLARPPQQVAAPASADQDVHISIGHIEVRAPSPLPAPVAPVRRAPSITLAEYLRRRPGAGR